MSVVKILSQIAVLAALSFLFPLFAAGSVKEPTLREALAIGTRIRNECPKELLFETAKKSETEAQTAGLRVIRGKHLHLITDLPDSEEIERLPQIFDAAVPLWAEYFRVPAKTVDDWTMVGVLIGDSKRFASTAILRRVPNLRHGFSVGHWLWIREQKSDYYRRHLLLHEGVHGFVNNFFGSCGPSWYMEGLAELLGTHHWDDKTQQLTLPYFPENREAVPYWGRIRIVNDLRVENQTRSVESVLTMSFDEADDTPSYAWSWALAAFLNGHPLYGDSLRDAVVNVSLPHKEFTDRFRVKIESVSSGRIRADWSDYLEHLDYGYDFQKTAIDDMDRGASLKKSGKELRIQADRGWQNGGILVEKGKAYSFLAQGRYHVGREERKILASEPNGVTIRYYRGRPLGILLGAVLSDKEKEWTAFPIGESTTWTSPVTGTIFFRVNDSPSELADNEGEVVIQIGPGR